MRKSLIKLLILSISLNPIISLISCTDDKPGIIDDRETTESLEKLKIILERGIDTEDALSVRNTYDDGFNYVANYVKKLNRSASAILTANNKKLTDKLTAKNNIIQVMITLGLSKIAVDANLLNVLSKLQAVIKLDLIKTDRWDQTINMTAASIEGNEIDSSDTDALALRYIQSTQMFGSNNKYGLEVSLPESNAKKLQTGEVTVPLEFNLVGEPEKEILNVKLTNIKNSELDKATTKLSNVDLAQTGITSKNQNSSIINYLNTQLQAAYNSSKDASNNVIPIKVEEILNRDEKEDLSIDKDHLLKVKLIEDIDTGRSQEAEITLKNVTPFVHTMAYDLMDKIFQDNDIIFDLKVGDTQEELKRMFKENLIISQNYYFTQALDFTVAPTSYFNTDEPTTESEPIRSVDIRWRLVGDNKISKPRQIKYTVKEI